MLWNGEFSPKLKLFTWKAIQRTIPLKDNLVKRGIMDGTSCLHCGEEETAAHLFLHCSFATRVWNLIPLKVPINLLSLEDIKEGLSMSKSWISLPPFGCRVQKHIPMGPSHGSFGCYGQLRNNKIFENRAFSVEETSSKALASAREWQLAQI